MFSELLALKLYIMGLIDARIWNVAKVQWVPN